MNSNAADHDIRRNMIQNLLNQKVQKEQWVTDVNHSDIVRAWVKKVYEYTLHYTSLSVMQYQLEELLHYLTFEDFSQLRISANSEYQYITKLYLEQGEKVQQTTGNQAYLQHPDVTFGEKVSSAICVKCKKSEATMQTRQTRSADEPSDYFFECKDTLNCGHRWKN
jgi:DNA-directed RNA polymerase subunit M/transcription elongation factor TFIIS